MSAPLGFPIPSEEAVLRIATGCSLDCTFCRNGQGRTGLTLEQILAPDFQPPSARRVLICAGDVLRADLAPLVRRLRQAASNDVLAYGHAGGADPEALKILAAAGLTGVLASVPSAERKELSRLTRGTATLSGLAQLVDAVVAAGLDLEAEIPVLPSTLPTLVDTARRLLARAGRLAALHLSFGPEPESGGPRSWDIRTAREPLSQLVDWAREAGVLLRLLPPSPPPCLLDLPGVGASHYPSLRAPIRRSDAPGPFEACARCPLAGTCATALPYFAADPALGPVQPIDATLPRSDTAGDARPTSAELHLRRRTVDDLAARLRAAPQLACTSPWSVLTAHDPVGGVAPCRGTLLRPEVEALTGNWMRTSLLDVWNSPGMRYVRRSIASGNAGLSCREHCPVFHGTTHSEAMPPILPAGRRYFENLVLQMQELLEGAEVLRSRPTCLVIAPSLRCNHKCRMCAVHSNERALNDLPDVVFDSVIELLPTLRDLTFAGAEPLMSSRFGALVRACDAERFPDLQLSMTTNGSLLDAAMLSDLSGARFHTIIVSINAVTPATFERISGNADGLDRVLDNTRALLRSSRTWRQRPRVILSFVVMRSNVHEAAAFVDLARELGTDLRFLPVEKDRSHESVFTDEDLLRQTLAIFENDVRPRAAGLPQETRFELDAIQDLMRRRLQSMDFRPL